MDPNPNPDPGHEHFFKIYYYIYFFVFFFLIDERSEMRKLFLSSSDLGSESQKLFVSRFLFIFCSLDSDPHIIVRRG